MHLHSCGTHSEDRQSNSESILRPQYKPQEHSGMKFKERMHAKGIKKETRLRIGEQFPNIWSKMKGTTLNDLTFHK